MTVPANDRRIQYTATAGQTIFPYDFKITANTEIAVLQTVNATGVTTTLTLTTEYTVSGVGDAGGGNITLVTGAAVNDTITITGTTPLTRVTDFNQAGDFLTSDLNDQLDKLTDILQENDTETNRALLLAPEDTASSLVLPVTADRISKYLAFDASGDPLASAAQSGVPTSTFMATVLDDETAAAALTTLGFSTYIQTLIDDTTAAAARTTLAAQQDVVTTRGDIVRGSSGGVAERLALGADKTYLKSDGTDAIFGAIPSADLPAGSTIQEVNTQTGAVATGTTIMPGDDTIPQNNEGDEYMTLAITPTNTNNKLKIEIIASVSHSGTAITCTAALFQDSTADALAAQSHTLAGAGGSGFIETLTLTHYMTAGTTSATTFKLRLGGAGAGTTTFNGFGGARKLGGVMASSITIKEIQV
jgi:hypothetical protein|tara:strand:+ start:1485 stop:2738 length:1254 start_codon:yes stop_codon:yes gene_type:complete